MLINDIVRGVNHLLAGEQLTYSQLKPHLDAAIDDINRQLGTIYPAFSELASGTSEYNCFNDSYIRSVVMFGAAYHFYQVDEEGLDVTPALSFRYRNNMFFMVRDTINNIPPQYQQEYNVDPNAVVPAVGVITFKTEEDAGGRGMAVSSDVW